MKPTVRAIRDGFLQAGFQSFNFDATNSFGESEGDFEESSLQTFWEDLEDVVKWVQEQEWLVKPLALAGHSKGGYAVVRYAQEHPDEVDFLVPVAPVVSGELSFEAHKTYNPEEFGRWKREGILERVGKEGHVKRQHWWQMEERLRHDLLPNAEMLTMPTLLLVGSEDTSCPPEHVQKLYDAMPEGKKEMKIIDGAPHSFYEPQERAASRTAIKEWLNNAHIV